MLRRIKNIFKSLNSKVFEFVKQLIFHTQTVVYIMSPRCSILPNPEQQSKTFSKPSVLASNHRKCHHLLSRLDVFYIEQLKNMLSRFQQTKWEVLQMQWLIENMLEENLPNLIFQLECKYTTHWDKKMFRSMILYVYI